MDALEFLKQQHDEVKALFGKYQKATEDDARSSLFLDIADRFAAHATLEEQRFYPAVYRGEEMEDLLREAVEEHLSAKRIIADLLELPVTDPQFDAKMQVLQEQVEHHVKEEETGLFPRVQKSLGREEREALGVELEELYRALMEEEQPREAIPGETDRAPPIH